MKKYDVITSGYVSMDRMIKVCSEVKPGFTSIIRNADNTKIYYGGCSTNIACALAKLNKKALPIIRVGADYKETGFCDFLQSSGVCTEGVTMVKEDMTSNCYLIENLADNQHVTIFYPGAMDGKYAREMDDEFFQNARLGVITVGSKEDNAEFFRKCKKYGLPLVFGMKADFDAFPEAFLKELLYYSDIIFTNEVERKTIEQCFGLECITRLLHEGNAKLIVTTLGKDGSLVYRLKDGHVQECRVGILPAEKIVDSTGTGDAYIAGFLYGYLNGMSDSEACMCGSIVSSYVIRQMGCVSNLPTEAQLLWELDKMRRQQ